MQVTEVSERGLLFTFGDPYTGNVYVITGESSLFICDTYCGPDPMRDVMTRLSKKYDLPSRVIVFNSHADYDHVWGNCYFEGQLIVGHELCRERIIQEWDEVLEKHLEHQRGNVIRLPPNITFKERVRFEEEEVEFFHTPGHTRDSSSCFDRRDNILFVGDNIESPIPYINMMNIEDYRTTLGRYLNSDAEMILAGHDPPQDNTELVRSNLDYVTDFGRWAVDLDSLNRKAQQVHLINAIQVIDSIKRGELSAAAEVHYEEIMKLLQSMEKTAFVNDSIHKIESLLSSG
ncbi:MBL fold metallo-hydrolase [Candidatus Thorarchaeota archaeon]|nr:MAG: MBL fold metallo-hydrolase [Candidatus Thorarchaeota archaeon]